MNAKKITFWKKEITLNRTKVIVWLVTVFLLAGIASGVFINHIFPRLTSVPGFRFFAPRFTVVVNRTEQIRVNEGVEVRELYERIRASTVTIISYAGSNSVQSSDFTEPVVGNGLIVTSDGVIFTTKSVVGESQNNLNVVREDGTRMNAAVLAFDPKSELAVIRVDARDWPVIDFGVFQDRLVGEKLVASGPSLTAFNQAIFIGELASKSTSAIDFSEVLDADAINQFITVTPGPHNSFTGSSLVDANRRVAGLVTSAGILTGEYLRNALDLYLNSKTLTRPRFDFNYQFLPPIASESAGYPTRYGARVVNVSGVAQGKLAADDFIVGVGGTELSETKNLESFLNTINPGAHVMFDVYRKGTIIQVELETGILQ